MTARTIRVPDIGEGVTEAEIVEWCVRVGDKLTEDQIIGSVMTEKAAVEIPSPEAGIVIALGGEVGDVLAVGAELARIELDSAAQKSSNQTSDQQEKRPLPSSRSQRDTVAGKGSKVSVDATARSAETRIGDTSIRSVTVPRARAAPAVRHRARQLGLHLDELSGSGPDGRITHADLDRLLLGYDRDVMGNSALSAVPEVDEVTDIRLLGVRRGMARQMQLAWARIPHFSYIEEVDVTVLETLRAGLVGDGASPSRPSPLPFVVRALVRALDSFPQMNAHYDDEAEIVRQHSARHVGIATATANGLIVPIVRHAESLGIRELVTQISRVTETARAGQVSREELAGGTITVTSLGALGGLASTPIINHPQVAIVAVNRIVKRPVCRDGLVKLRHMMNLSASFDHRVIDGHEAARFVQQIREALEQPGTLLMTRP